MEANDLLNSLLISSNDSLGIFEIFVAFTFPFILTIPIVFFYKKFTKYNSYSQNFVNSLFLFSSLTSIITLMIGGNLARAIGVFGAVSLIRFRTAIKSPLDAVYLFWTLALGFACGTGNYTVAALIVFFGCFYMALIELTGITKNKHVNCVIKAQYKDEDELTHNENLIKKNFKSFEKVNVLYRANEEDVHIYSGLVALKTDINTICKNIEKEQNIKNIEVVNSEATVFM